MQKEVIIDPRAVREINDFPTVVKVKIGYWVKVLSQFGQLEMPVAKKLTGRPNIFELRIKYKGEWRVLYSYFDHNLIVILVAFPKKTWKLPQNQILTAINRSKDY